MTTLERREKIRELLEQSAKPISATALARQFHVSRQVVVGDIALLRASGTEILATPNGYIHASHTQANGNILRTLACNHGENRLAEELYTIIDNGGAMIDVIVDHPIYGQLTGQLNLFSRYDTDRFLKSVEENRALLLSRLTDGVHLHTISCKDEDTFQRITAALAHAGILLDRDE